MKFLPVDKSKEIKDQSIYPGLIRTGTVSEGSCFYHSVLKGLNKDNYSKMNEKDKLKYMIKLRNDIANTISLEYYKKNLNNISSLRLSQKLDKFLKLLYDFINNPASMLKKDKNIDFLTEIINNSITVFKMITTVITKDEFVGIIQDKDITSSPSIDEYITNFYKKLYSIFLQKLEEEGVHLSQEKLDICNSKIKKNITTLFNSIVKKQYEQYKKELRSTNEWASDLMFSIVADYLGVDIYFININNNEVIAYDHVSKGDRPSVVVGSINETHFENIGIIDEDKNITRLFEPDHPFIIKLKEIIKLKKN